MKLGMYSSDPGFSVSIPNFIKVAESDTHRETERERERERERGNEEEKERERNSWV